MNILNILKKRCGDGTRIWFWNDCPEIVNNLNQPETPIIGPDTESLDPDILDNEISASASTSATPFIGFNIGAEEICGTFKGSRPTIAVNSANVPCIVIDRNWENILQSFSKATGTWKEREFAMGLKNGAYDASRLYMPHMEIDSKDRAWVSCKFGCKEYGDMLGQGLWIVPDLKHFESKRFTWISETETHKGNGNVVLDPLIPNKAKIVATEGKWIEVNAAFSRIGKGTIGIGKSGEKIRSLISPKAFEAGILHIASGGYSAQSSSYINNTMSKSVVWANYAQYPEQGNDMAHPAIGIDLTRPAFCYISAPYKGVSINIWNGTQMLFSPASIKIIDPKGNMGGTDRFAAQWSPYIQGGAFLTWVNNNRIKIVKVSKKGKVGAIMDICSGVSPSICTDKNGDVHLAYVNNGMRYRKLTLKIA